MHDPERRNVHVSFSLFRFTWSVDKTVSARTAKAVNAGILTLIPLLILLVILGAWTAVRRVAGLR